MRRILANEVRKQFNACMKERLPQFKNVKPVEIELRGKMIKEIPLGYRLYLWEQSDELYFYLLLEIPSKKMGDAFTIECAWTRNRRYPALLGHLFPYDIPRSQIVHDEPQNGDFRFRMGMLWEPRKDHWWWVAPQPNFEGFTRWLMSGAKVKNQYEPPEMPVEEALKNVTPCVHDAVDHIVDYAIPYFEGIIADEVGDCARTVKKQ